MPVEELDRELVRGGGSYGGKYRIYEHFTQQHTPEENARFLKDEFGTGGSSPRDGSAFNVWHDAKGIRFADGYINANEYTFSWKQVAARIHDLIALDRYFTPEDMERYPQYQAEQERRAIQRTQREVIESVSQLPPAEKRDTLAVRFADYLNGLEEYEKAYFEDNALDLPDGITARQVGELLQSPLQARRLTDALGDVQGGSTDYFNRIHARLFSEEIRALHPCEYVYKVGNEVTFGGQIYEVQNFDDRTVWLNEPQFPLVDIPFSREVFDSKLIESTENDHLRQIVVGEQEPAPFETTPRMLYQKHLPLLLEDLRGSDIFSQLRDRDSNAEVAYDLIHNWIVTASLDVEAYPGLMEALGLPEFHNWIAEDLFQKAYQDVVIDHESQLEQHEHLQDAPEWARRPPLSEQVREELYLRGIMMSESAIADIVAEYLENNEHGDYQGIADFIESELHSEDGPATETDIPERTVRDTFNEYSILFIQRVLRDEPYLNARQNSDEQNARTECDAAVDHVALSLGTEDMELYKLFHDTPGFQQRMRDYVFDRTYTQTKRKIQRVLKPPATRATVEQRNFRFLNELAPEILNGEATYLRFKSGMGMMPLSIDLLSRDGLSAAHYYEQNGDLMADPDMTFVFDREAGTLAARTFQQDGLGVYQRVEGSNGGINHALERQLNSFAAQWFRNIRNQGYRRDVMNVRYGDDELEIAYGEDGSVQDIDGEVTLVERYARERGIVLPAEKETTSVPQPQPGHEGWSEPATPDNAPEHPGKPSDDIDAYLPGAAPIMKREIVEGPLFDIELVQHHIPAPQDTRHNFRITDDALGHGGAKAKFRGNIEAITLLQTLETENRLATPAEQEILSRYVGWGGIAQAFEENREGWGDEYRELQALLAPEEYTAARASTLNAHYTSPTVIRAMYKAIENMGFKQGNILEPSCGIGNFFGLVPESMSASKLFGIELDPITGRIARQLYQSANIAVQGFETTELPDSFFDLAIGNVPFGEYSVADRRYDKHKFHIHDYFFAKTLDKVRPGGVVAFITSKYTMDKQNPAVRKYIAQHAELLGAIRLPNTAFKANAGTEVTADIIFLQKRDRALEINPDWVHLGQTDDGITVNSYFTEHPEMILGEMVMESTQYGHDTTCRPFPDRDLADLLGEAVQNIHAEIADFERNDQPETEGAIPADPSVRNFSYTIYKSNIYYRENSIMVPQELSATAYSRIRGMIGIRDSARRLIEFQTGDMPENEIQREQARLGVLYDTFTAKYGLLSDRANAAVFRDDDSYPLLCSLEVLDKDGKLERKSDMFSKRTIRPHVPITHVDTAAEALTVSMAEKARVDLGYMSDLTGFSQEKLIGDLQGVIFRDLGNGQYSEREQWQMGAEEQQGAELYLETREFVTADAYLSGNVREKLSFAYKLREMWTNNNLHGLAEQITINIEALEAAQPKDLTASEISVRLGATWVPTDVVQDFIFELLEPGYWAQREVQVHYSQYTAEWNITGKSVDKHSIAARVTYGTDRISAYHIIEQTLNLRTVKVFDTVIDEDGKEKRVLNAKETAIAQGKQEIIKAKFLDWVWDDPDRRERLCGIYNSLYNSTRPREYDGSHIQFVGMNPEKHLDAHQKNGVARHLYGGNTLLAHVVGAGKTFTMVAAAMESKRLGLSHKGLFIVPNNIVGQFASEFLQLYPSANVLMVTAKDFEKQNRRKFCARIATGDYDGIVMAHSQFEKLAMSVEWQKDFLQRQVDDLAEGIADIKWQDGERVTVKAMERIRKSLQTKIQKLNDQDRKDDMLTFEELGVDLLFVDEADLYKNLMLVTKMRNVAGIGQTDAQKASDLFMKTRYLDALTGRRGVVFATGTPISNTVAEMYTMQRYLQYDTLVAHGLEHFDCWASTFGETVTAMELAPEGTGFRMKTRFAQFHNIPELMAMFREVADIQTADMLNLPTPKVNYHVIKAKPSEQQRDMVQGLAERADRIRKREVAPTEDNMLLVTNDGRKLALDQRLVNPLLPDVPGSKVNLCVENMFRIWQDTAAKRLTQLGFVDLSTPKDGIEFDVYHDVKEKLLLLGVPSDEIAFIHEAKNEAQKQALFGRVRTGAVRVLLGSTAKMGAGTNVQDLIKAMHDLDCPWRPRDLEQREGRGKRRGNTNAEIDLFRYVTEGTFDAYLYQLNETKQRFISQIFTSKTPERVMQDVDETVLNFAQVKAIATGDERIMELCTLEADVSRLKLLRSSFMSERYALQDKAIKYLPARIRRLEGEIRGFEADAALAAQTSPASMYFAPMTVEGKTYSAPKDAGFAILEACKAFQGKEPIPLGEYRGFQMEVLWDHHGGIHMVRLCGQEQHKVEMGVDARGNISRLDNALTDLPKELQARQHDLGEARQQLTVAQAEKDRPFPQETELSEKTARLGELKLALQIDEREPEFLADDAPDEGDGTDAPQRRKSERER
ncbi:MAG: SNF2-related protein [Firmicutes bacterium]|nr:SNF2-related protein [Bacillota bacterium]